MKTWIYFSIGIGLATGAATSLLTNTALSPEALAAWGWRIPFLLAATLGLIGRYVRSKLSTLTSRVSTPAFVIMAAALITLITVSRLTEPPSGRRATPRGIR